VSVSRETVAAVVRRFDVPDLAVTAKHLEMLIAALAAESDPPTTVREPSEALDIHVADSLAGLSVPGVRSASRIADVGAGAGFPGLVLAAALPGARVDLIESTRRKCEVIDRLAAAAGLAGRARAVHARGEQWAATADRDEYDVVTARALASLPVVLEYAAPLLRLGGIAVAWKGARDPDEEAAGERAAAELGLQRDEIAAVTPYPGSLNRHLYVYSKVTATPVRFPRRPGLAQKKPLA
jgi:16S rRNA (guanine527-N7)-methyltransferase